MFFAFDDFALDTDRRELRRNGVMVPVQPQVFDVLAYLVEHRDRVVSRDDLLEAVWGGRIVSESTLTTRINSARVAIGDTGEAQRLIRTARSKGFRFVVSVAEGVDGGQAGAVRAWTLADRLPIAVMPFEAVAGDASAQIFASGLTQDLVATLCRLPELLVISHVGRAESDDGSPQALQADYTVEGSAQRVGGAVRITARLVETRTGHHLWGGRLDRPAEDVLAVQDEIVRTVLEALEARLAKDRPDLGKSGFSWTVPSERRTRNLEAWLLYAEAMFELWNFTRAAVRRVRALCEKAVELDPSWSEPRAGIAWSYWWEGKQGWIPVDEAVALGMPQAERATELGPQHPFGYNQISDLKQLAGDHEGAIATREFAVRLAPSHASTLLGYGAVLHNAGDLKGAKRAYADALRLCLRPPRELLWTIVHAELEDGDVAAAAAATDRLMPDQAMRTDHFAIAAIAYAAVDRMGDARAAAEAALQSDPALTGNIWARTQADHVNQARIAEMARLLEAAGVPA